jgi:hypothetical protein
MNKDKILATLTTAGKVIGFITGLGAVPFVAPHVGVLIFAGASTLKEVIKFAGDLIDDGQKNDSFKP